MTEGVHAALHLVGSQASYTFDTRVYSLPALKRAAYRLADRCTVAFGELNGDLLVATMLVKDGADVELCVRELLDEALDQDLRAEIAAATAPVRDLILAHAFSRTRLVTTGEE